MSSDPSPPEEQGLVGKAKSRTPGLPCPAPTLIFAARGMSHPQAQLSPTRGITLCAWHPLCAAPRAPSNKRGSVWSHCGSISLRMWDSGRRDGRGGAKWGAEALLGLQPWALDGEGRGFVGERVPLALHAGVVGVEGLADADDVQAGLAGQLGGQLHDLLACLAGDQLLPHGPVHCGRAGASGRCPPNLQPPRPQGSRRSPACRGAAAAQSRAGPVPKLPPAPALTVLGQQRGGQPGPGADVQDHTGVPPGEVQRCLFHELPARGGDASGVRGHHDRGKGHGRGRSCSGPLPTGGVTAQRAGLCRLQVRGHQAAEGRRSGVSSATAGGHSPCPAPPFGSESSSTSPSHTRQRSPQLPVGPSLTRSEVRGHQATPSPSPTIGGSSRGDSGGTWRRGSRPRWG